MSTEPCLPAVLRRIQAAAFCMDGGFFLISTAVPFKVLELGGGPVALGLAPAVASLAYVAFTLLTGRWSDRGGRTWFCWAGNLSLVAFAVLAFQIRDLALLISALVLMSLGKALFWPVLQATLGDLSGPGELERNTAAFNVSWSSGKSLGFLAGGLLLARFGFQVTFLCGSALVVGSFLALPRPAVMQGAVAAMQGTAARRGGTAAAMARGTATTGVADVSAALRTAFRRMAWLANLASYGTAGVLGYHLPDWFSRRGWDAGRFGLFLAVIFLVQTVVLGLLGRRVRFAFSARRLLAPQLLALLAAVLLPLLGSFLPVLLLAPLFGLAFGVTYAGSIYYSLHAREQRGRNAGIHEALVGAGGFLPPLLGGLVARWSGWLGAPYLLAAGFTLLALGCQAWIALRIGPPTRESG
jgi:MFS family permease